MVADHVIKDGSRATTAAAAAADAPRCLGFRPFAGSPLTD